VTQISFSPDGGRILTASQDKTARIWDAKTGALLVTLTGHNRAVASAQFSADGKRVGTALHDKTARVWDAQTAALSLRCRPTPARRRRSHQPRRHARGGCLLRRGGAYLGYHRLQAALNPLLAQAGPCVVR